MASRWAAGAAAGRREIPAELVVNDDYYKACQVDYHGGQRYPHLERDAGKPDYLDELIKP